MNEELIQEVVMGITMMLRSLNSLLEKMGKYEDQSLADKHRLKLRNIHVIINEMLKDLLSEQTKEHKINDD